MSRPLQVVDVSLMFDTAIPIRSASFLELSSPYLSCSAGCVVGCFPESILFINSVVVMEHE